MGGVQSTRSEPLKKKNLKSDPPAYDVVHTCNTLLIVILILYVRTYGVPFYLDLSSYKWAPKCPVFRNGHTTSIAPHPVRSVKLSGVGPG